MDLKLYCTNVKHRLETVVTVTAPAEAKLQRGQPTSRQASTSEAQLQTFSVIPASCNTATRVGSKRTVWAQILVEPHGETKIERL